MDKLNSRKQACCGCTACLNICPKNAIKMLPDEKGFLYPQVDHRLCVDCGMCQTVCPFHDGFSIVENFPEPDIYAVKHKSDDIRMKSSSGGIFSVISDYVLDKGGVVYGATFDQHFTVCHKRAATRDERDTFRGSKYVQSDLTQIFQEVNLDLASGRYVLFSGTPCQTAGLYSFLHNRVDTGKLFLCDVVCHGAPSPKIFEEYIAFLKRRFHSEISGVTFRYKPLGWRNQAAKVCFKNSSSTINDIFHKLFLSDIMLRDSCYDCKFANLHRPSDITIGDFWGIEKAIPDFDDDKGISLVLVNTPKGRQIFSNVEKNIVYRKSDAINCMQVNLKQPSKPSPRMQEFWRDYHKRGFPYVATKYTDAHVRAKIKKHIKAALKKLHLYNKVKKIIRQHK